ncbi:pancreatic lipase-related protein 2-like [Rhodnius prolixus]|uniref:pancreatic lipase-related protein 2-like n=1 Tax=Rhodnius prolixus TaxID=13249 RepID=UPI003D187F5B
MEDVSSLLLIPAYLNSSLLNLLYVEYFKHTNVSFCPLIYTRYLSECIAKSLLNIYKYLPMFKPENTHIIGGSMGSLVASYVGSYFEGSIFRITALDPPEYLAAIYQPPVAYNLSPIVAKIVDVYHTNMGQLGTWKAVGTVDVIFNKGDEQPQCYSSSKCAHRIAIYYFMLTIMNRKAFWAQPCTYRLYDYLTNEIDQVCSPLVDRDRQLVGEYMDSKTNGTFLVNTWPEFALGKT